MKCLNCENEYQGTFCNNCGQKSSTQKITAASVLNDFFKLITNTDKGLFFNLINLTIKPRKTIINFIEGKRKNLFLPIQYVVLGITLLTLVEHYFGMKVGTDSLVHGNDLIEGVAKKGNNIYDLGVNVGKMQKTNIKYFLLSYIVLFALPAKLFYKRFTLPEHITIQAFIVGHVAFVSLVLFPFLRLGPLTNPIFYVCIFIMTFTVFYRKNEVIENFLSAFFVVAIGITLFFIMGLAIYAITNI